MSISFQDKVAIVGAGGGVYQSAWITMNQGTLLPEAERTVEGFAQACDRISDRSSDAPVRNGVEQAMQAMAMLQRTRSPS